MPFRINSAPEILQRTMNQLVEGLEGTKVAMMISDSSRGPQGTKWTPRAIFGCPVVF